MISAIELSQRIWESMKDKPQSHKQGALLQGVTMLLAHSQIFDKSVADPSTISKYRQAFTQWKAVAKSLSMSQNWKRNTAFSQEQEYDFLVAAFPAYFLRHAPLTLLYMLDNNMLLGYKPDAQMQGNIQQLRWKHPEARTRLPGKGLARNERVHRGVAR